MGSVGERLLGWREGMVDGDVPLNAEERGAQKHRIARLTVCHSPDDYWDQDRIQDREDDGGSKIKRIRHPADRGRELVR